MQTTKWGKEGWCFLESIVGQYPEAPSHEDKKLYLIFLTHIGQILPCIYCRQSYQDFIKDLPIIYFLESGKTLRYWLYLIHNKVNDKLRKQGYLHTPNPSYDEIVNKYKITWKGQPCQWDFLYSVIFNYAVEPTIIDRGNYLLFFQLLKKLMPNNKIRPVYERYYDLMPIGQALRCRDTMISWFYKLQTEIYTNLGISQIPYAKLCEKYEGFRASCNKVPTNSCRLPNK
jgi:hypothetical protein